ncbi:iron-enterobactin transporter ATP-binding protein [Clostridium zeae]|uniref:Iron-enterobactin transporter ATP-binding protein n=1 Tax=Clostridium zeae TaxID=2759022 RepID=A0ABQ1EI61_9CLOT|nr:ABC transporter ATP-binding protein [Clostridium zeae]GFZ34389.1 iron-enterobactin transporter ATP-binding protein [Clostridium zeae]
MLSIKDLTLSYDEKIILKDINVEIPKGKITVLIGANGSGKSTLLKSMSRLLSPQKGHVYLNSKDIHSMHAKELAKSLSFLPQSASAPGDLSIYDLAKQGRYPYHSLMSTWTESDKKIVESSLEKMGLLEIKDEKLDNLSGGQKQRAWIALSLVQDTEIILLDEPTNHLDIKYQLEILELLKFLNRTSERTIVLVLHDINHALKYGDNIIALLNGNIYSQGDKNEIVTESLINTVFDINCKLIASPVEDSLLCIPYL